MSPFPCSFIRSKYSVGCNLRVDAPRAVVLRQVRVVDVVDAACQRVRDTAVEHVGVREYAAVGRAADLARSGAQPRVQRPDARALVEIQVAVLDDDAGQIPGLFGCECGAGSGEA